jgi:hypothetical protein
MVGAHTTANKRRKRLIFAPVCLSWNGIAPLIAPHPFYCSFAFLWFMRNFLESDRHIWCFALPKTAKYGV